MIGRSRLKYLCSLSQKKVRAREGLLLVEGVHVVGEAVAGARDRVRELFLGEAAARSERGQALQDAGLPVTLLEDRDVAELSETRTPAGAFALVEDPCGPLRPGDLPREGVVLLAAGVADPGNLGTLIRTAAGLGAGAVVATKGTVEPTNPKVVRATAGTLFRVPVRRGEAAEVKAAGYEICVADSHGDPAHRFTHRPARVALAVGNEPRGVDDPVRTLAATTIAVRQYAGVESLNVTVAAGILLHTLRALPVQR